MAITAKCDIFNVPAGSPVDVQPAVGEVWLIKSFPYAPIAGTVNAYLSISLYDGVDEAPFLDLNGANQGGAVTALAGVAAMFGTSTADNYPRGYGGFAEWSVIVTNTVRLRYFRLLAGKMGYSGVLL